jgi:DNA ligase-1
MIKRPLLAAKATDEELRKLPYPMLLSPKIDGIRALVVGGRLLSRSMKPIPNEWTQALFGRPELEGLDGELVVGNPWDKNLMQQTTSGVMSKAGVPDVTYHIFDKWNEDTIFIGRIEQALLTGTRAHLIYGVKHQYVHSYEEMIQAEQEYILQGYEGVMLRSPYGSYKQNRSTLREAILVKVKRFTDAEATIIGYEPLYRNLNAATKDERGYTKRSHHQDNQLADDLLGSLTVRNESGIDFSIGSGFTDNQRRELWRRRDSLPGRIVKYKCFETTGVLDKPRFPIFLGFRDPIDL